MAISTTLVKHDEMLPIAASGGYAAVTYIIRDLKAVVTNEKEPAE